MTICRPVSGSVLIFFFFFSLYISFFFFLIFICSGFCHTLKWDSHGFTCVPHPDPPSHLPPHPLFWYSFPMILKYFRARVEETWVALPCEFEFELFPHKIFFPTHSIQFFLSWFFGWLISLFLHLAFLCRCHSSWSFSGLAWWLNSVQIQEINDGESVSLLCST